MTYFNKSSYRYKLRFNFRSNKACCLHSAKTYQSSCAALCPVAHMATERVARKQVPRPIPDEESIDKTSYNIWHHKPNFRRRAEPKMAATHRCNPARDAGRTKGLESGASFCCIDFARGMCAAGYSCNYLHRIPTVQANQCTASYSVRTARHSERKPMQLNVFV